MKTPTHSMANCFFSGARGRMAILYSFTAFLLGLVVPAAASKALSAFPGNTISSGVIPGMAGPTLLPAEIPWRVSTIAKNLRSPDGLARDPESGDLYVTEEDAANIVRIKLDGTRQALFDSSTPLYEESGTTRKQVTGLRSPEGLALDNKGTLYVVEDIPGGRLIAFDLKARAANSRAGGRVVPLPIRNSRYAWESVDVRPTGELLLAGSTMESFLSEPEKEGMFRGAILYRDEAGEWWMPLNPSMASYSAVCFSSDGHYAFFAGEVPGDVGCLDLRSRNLRTYRADKTFHSPEGLCALPDGSALVAEESGKIYRVDPMADTIQLLYDNKSTIESVYWDNVHRRLLVSDDQRGWVLALAADLEFYPSFEMVRQILFEGQSNPVETIPEHCPAYLAEVLKLGGYDPGQESGDMEFRRFARHFSLVAVDAEAMLLPHDKPVADPIKRVQFVIVAPYLLGIQEGEFIWSSSGFTAIKESGAVVQTRMVQRGVIQGDLMEGRFTPLGGQKIALPQPFCARITTEGIASVHFMGMGVTPDFHLVLNTAKPDLSFMLVMEPDGSSQQYGVTLPANTDGSHWVIALEHNEPDAWRRLSFPN